MTTLITSQDYLDAGTVNTKVSNNDFTVLVSPVFEIDGDEYQVLLDGHHSYAAAKQAGVEPVFEVATTQDADYVAYLTEGDVESFLEAAWMGDDWKSVETGSSVF